MIDIIKAKKIFADYVSNYDPSDVQINLKIRHIESVTNVAKQIAQKLNLSEEDVKLAEMIALLHDIGRFEQIKIYHTFIDKDSIDHGAFGVELLKNGLMRKFIETPEYDEIIYNAILNHNKPKIDSKLDEKTILFSKILRDADKTDIFNIIMNSSIEAVYNGCKDMSNEVLTPKIYKDFMEKNLINYKDMQTNADIVAAHLSYVFDFNFDFGLEIVKNQNYIEKLVDKVHFKNLDTINQFEIMKEKVNNYIDDKLKI